MKIWYLHIKESCKIRDWFEIIIEKKILWKYGVCVSYCEKRLKLTTLSFYMLISCFLASLCWGLVLHVTKCSSAEYRHNFFICFDVSPENILVLLCVKSHKRWQFDHPRELRGLRAKTGAGRVNCYSCSVMYTQALSTVKPKQDFQICFHRHVWDFNSQ